ncbi:MAG: hypothetical protein KAW47_04365 [Thermoplasmatales archaeon]|nr:hypothetical protein [Thermoplasmatales archaeon]
MWNTPTKSALTKIPRLYETEGIEAKDKLIHLHFFVGGSDWYIAEYDGEKKTGLLEVECDEYWDVRKAMDVRLIRECQGWKNPLVGEGWI